MRANAYLCPFMKRFVLPFLFAAAAAGAVAVHIGYFMRRAACEAVRPTPPPERVHRLRLCFAGDVMAHLPQVAAARRADGTCDFSGQFRHVREHMAAADLCVVNLETTLSEAEPYTGYPLFRSPVSLACALADAGVDAAMLANNHCCDGGERGIETTLRALAAHGIRSCGVFADSADYRANRILRFEHDSLRVALLNYTYGTNGMPVPSGRLVNRIDTAAMARDLAEAGDGADCRIVVLHWGTEYERHPDRTQRALAAFLRRHGADWVVGSHPHVIQTAESDSTGGVLYSLGNFVSNQRKRYTDGGLLAEITVEKRMRGDSTAGLRHTLSLTPVWVALPGYRILPRGAADTMELPAVQRSACERFFADTEELLNAAPRKTGD